jgi:DNA-binding XRE family transcriptional regulator
MNEKKKMTNDEKYSIAQDLFLETDKTQKEIAEIIHVTEKTLGKWKTEGEWDLLKSASTVTARKIIENLYKKAHALSEDPKSKPNDIIQIANSIEKLSNKKVTISQIINVFKDFTTYAFTQNAELAKEINLLQKKYVDYKIGEK